MKNLIYLFLLVACTSNTNLGSQNQTKKYAGGLAKSPKIHFIVFAATNDQNQIIRDGCENSYQNMKELVTNIAKINAYRVESNEYIGDDFKKTYLARLLDNSQIESQDLVFFYFIGHGYQNKGTNCQKQFPLLYLGNTRVASPSPQESIGLNVVYEKLKAKNPKFLFLMTDACQIPATENGLGGANKNQALDYNLKSLFGGQGEVIITACQPNNPAYITKNGGIMTTEFVRLLSEKENGNWQTLLNNLQKTVPNIKIRINGQVISTGQIPQRITCKP